MKKNLLRIIAWNLVVLMLFSFPFCAFAEEDVLQMQLGENILPNTAGYGEVIEAEFTPQEAGIYAYGVQGDAVELYVDGALLASVELNFYHTLMFYGEAGKTYQFRLTDDGEDGIIYTLTHQTESLLPESGYESYVEYYFAAQNAYVWFKDAQVDVYDETTGEDVRRDGLTYYLKANHAYRLWFSNMGDGTYELLSSPIIYRAPATDGSENADGCYCFSPEQSGVYEANICFLDCSADYSGADGTYNYEFHKGETYYFYADRPFTLERKQRDSLLHIGSNNLFIDEAGETEWRFTSYNKAIYQFTSPNENSAIAVYLGETLLSSTNGTTPLALELEGDTEYKVTYVAVQPILRDRIDISRYEWLPGIGQTVEWGSYAFAPVESGYYAFTSSVELMVEAQTNLSVQNEMDAYFLEEGKIYLFYAYDNFSVEKIERTYLTLKTDGTENAAGYYKFTPEKSGRYHSSISLQELTESASYDDGSCDYQLSEGTTYLFYADQPFTFYYDDNIKLGENYLNPNQPGSTQWTFTPEESGWYSFGLRDNGPFVSIALGDQTLDSLSDCSEPLYLKLEADTQYTLTYTVEFIDTNNVLIVEKLPILTGEQGAAEGGKTYVFQAEQAGYYWFLGSYSGVWDVAAGDWLSSNTEAYYLDPNRDYRVPVWDEGATYKYLGTEIPYAELEQSGEETPAGFYSFTPQQSGIYHVNGYLEGEGINSYEQTETESTYALYKGTTYQFYCRTPFTLTLLSMDSTLNIGNNPLFLDECGESVWTFAPEQSGWYRILGCSEYATVDVYENEELLGTGREYGNLYLYLNAGTTYDVHFSMTYASGGESIYIGTYESLSGELENHDAGDYAYTVEEDGYYFFGGSISYYDPAKGGSEYSQNGVVKLAAGQTILIEMYEPFSISKVSVQIPNIQGDENPAGYYALQPEKLTGYYFSIPVTFADDKGYEWNDQGYHYALAGGMEQIFYAEEPFTVIEETFTGELKVGSNIISDPEAELTFTPEEDGWYYLYGSSYDAETYFHLYEEDGTPLDGNALYLYAGNTYTVDTDAEEVYVRHYVPIALGEIADGGYYVFTPAESGRYIVLGHEISEAESHEGVEQVLGEALLEQGVTYLLWLEEGGSITKSDREYQPLVADGNPNPAGYYIFEPTVSGIYSFSSYVDGNLEWVDCNDETQTFTAAFYVGNTYRIGAGEAFAFALLPQTDLKLGENRIFGEANADVVKSFTPEEDGWYAFDIWGNELKLYQGEILLGQCDDVTEIIAQLEGGVTYELHYSYSEDVSAPYISIYMPKIIDRMTDLDQGSYLFIPAESGWYEFSDLWSNIYDVAAEEICDMEMGAFELQEGAVYYIANMMGSITKQERSYTSLDITDDQKAAGYYTFVAPSTGRYAFSTDIYLGNCQYDELGYDEELEAYIYRFFGGAQVTIYAAEPFYVSNVGDTTLQVGENDIYGPYGEEIERTFTPDATGWYEIYPWYSSSVSVYQGEELLMNSHDYGSIPLQLTAGVPYRVVVSQNEEDGWELLSVKYFESIHTIPETGGVYAFTPQESGYYKIEDNNGYPFDVTVGEAVDGWSGEYEFIEGHTYLLDFSGAMTYLGERVYTELVLDGTQKPAGYYTYTPDFSAGYIFSAEPAGLYNEHYEGDNSVFKLYAGNTYQFFVSEPFTVTKLEKTTVLNLGNNYIYDERGAQGVYTFTAPIDGWYEIYSNDLIEIFEGETSLTTEAFSGFVYLKLEEDTVYTITVERKIDPNYEYPMIDICYYQPRADLTAIPAGNWLITVDQSGYYSADAEVSIHNVTDMKPVGEELGTYYLEPGKEYLITIYPYVQEVTLTFAGEREYTELVPDGEQKPAGYYVYTAQKNTFLAFDVEPECTNYRYGEFDGRYVYWCGEEVTYHFYVDAPFIAEDMGDFLYETNADDTITILEYAGNSGDVYVPAEIDGKPVRDVDLRGLTANLIVDGVRISIAEGVEKIINAYDPHGTVRILELSSDVVLQGARFSEYGDLILTIPADRADLDIFSANAPAKVIHVFFGGTEQQWETLVATDPTNAFADAVVHYNASAEDYVITRNEEGATVFCTHCEANVYGCLHENQSYSYNKCNTERLTVCDDCGLAMGVEYVGEENATHEYGPIEPVKRPTCKEAGYGYKECIHCGDEKYATIDKTNTHTEGKVITDTPATCGKAGKGHINCAVCGTWMRNVTLSATGNHTAGALVTDKAPTCAVAGVGHKNCTVCGKVAASNVSIPATGKHTAGHWKTTVKATYEATGMDTKYCTVCNKKMETRTVAKLVKAAAVFKDVKTTDWYHEAVSYAYSNNLFKGVSENDFAPAQEMTRAMLVTVLWRYAGEPAGGTHPFKDVPKGEWYTEAVAWAARTGVVNGISADQFDPNATITREQMATILHRYAKSTGLNVSASANISGFKDGSKVNDWAKEGMQWAVGKGLINGSDVNGTILLDPANGATRGQVATILMRYIENIVKA